MKKLINLFLSIAMLLSITSFSFADVENNSVTNLDIDYSNHYATIQSINENIKKHIDSYILGENGKRIPLDVEVETTLEPNYDKLNLFCTHNTFVFKSKTKVKTSNAQFDKKWHDEIDAEAELTMTWKDVFGGKNKITNLSGNCTVNDGTFSKGWVYWGDHNAVSNAPNKENVGSSFDFKVNYTSTSFYGTVRADYKVYVKSPNSNITYDICVTVNPLV